MAKYHRSQILEEFVKDGDSWSKARQGYQLTLSMQIKATSMMANWIGGAFVHRDKKGDPNGRTPIEVVPVEQQRAALKFVIENTFFDESYGLTAKLLNHMSVDQWLDNPRGFGLTSEPTWPIHDRIMSIQASTLSQLMNPTVLRRVYDNEFRIESDQDALTLPELLTSVSEAIWKELGEMEGKDFSDRKPAISSLRHNLQTEHLQRLFDLADEQGSSNAALKPIANLASMKLKKLRKAIDEVVESHADSMDSYTKAHLIDARDRIRKWMDGPTQASL